MNRATLDRMERKAALGQAETSNEKVARRRKALDAEIPAMHLGHEYHVA